MNALAREALKSLFVETQYYYWCRTYHLPVRLAKNPHTGELLAMHSPPLCSDPFPTLRRVVASEVVEPSVGVDDEGDS